MSNIRKKQKFDWFYKKPAWKKIRLVALERDDHLCQHCLEKYDEMTPADVVHHIVYVEHDIQKALDIDNLVSLCHHCHNKIHGEDEKRKSVKSKRQKMIDSKKVNIVKV
ncbi:HNH endonuclease [Macrococcus epidermidis]|uniref:Putative HNH nuclease YajD n=1 Tax=Macrococcus epidermidis TaxID=1902580 RepID=A0A327ZS92_9STAP|nr:HNH endonuclease [Macrococcus epidermidis]RAK44997.1 HNH endonuclease [Macrococcus epidermidis]